jgi:hypothetical protein
LIFSYPFSLKDDKRRDFLEGKSRREEKKMIKVVFV